MMTGGEELVFTGLGVLTLAGLTVAAFVCSVFAGISAVGGGLLLAAVISPVLGVKAVVPVISVYALYSNVARAVIYRRSIAWRQVTPLMIPLIPAAVLGARIYVDLDPRAVALILGIVLIASVPGRRLMAGKKIQVGDKGLFAVGGVFGFYSGMSLGGGLILIPFLFGAGLFGQAVIATDALVSVAMNLTRAAMFGWHELLDLRHVIVGSLFGAVSFPGVLLARWIMDRTPVRAHTVAMEALLMVAGGYFLWKAYAG